MADKDWIEWNGGQCPVDPVAFVEVRFRAPPRADQVAMPERPACCFAWHHDGRNDDIIAYRLEQPA